MISVCRNKDHSSRELFLTNFLLTSDLKIYAFNTRRVIIRSSPIERRLLKETAAKNYIITIIIIVVEVFIDACNISLDIERC